MSPASVAFGALGSTQQLTATYKDSTGAATRGGTIVFSVAGGGGSAIVSSTGLITAVAPGQGVDTVVVSGSGLTARVPVSVTQVQASLTVSSPSLTPDTFFSSDRNRQFTATVRDSNNNVIPSPGTITWSSSAPNVAGVFWATGVVLSFDNGSATISATNGVVTGSRPVVVRRLAARVSVIPPPPLKISVDGDSLPVVGFAVDSSGTPINQLSWASSNTAVFRVVLVPAGYMALIPGNNGSAQLFISTPYGRADTETVTVTNQTFVPVASSVTIGDDFFKSGRNGSSNPAVDTVRVGGQVTWNFAGTHLHGVQSTGSPSFASSPVTAAGSYSLTFNTTGTYTYDCAVHGNAMTGIVVVR